MRPFSIGPLVIGFFGLINQNTPRLWFSGLFASKATFFLRNPGGVLLALWFICTIKPDQQATIPPHAPQLAVGFIGTLVSDCNDYNT